MGIAMKPKVAVIAPGSMGAAVGARLAEHGVKVVTSLAGRSAASAKRAADAGMIDASDSEIAAADFVLSIVPPGDAEALAERLKPALRAANRKPVYVDCNAVSPKSVIAIAGAVTEADCPFVDGGIIGGPPSPGSKGPSIYVSGTAAGRIEDLGQYGLRIRSMGGKIGDASALKMSYAGLNKGMVALGTAMVLAAERAGVGDALRAELAESQAAMLNQLTRGVPGMFPKAYRWVAELEEIARFAGPGAEAEIFNGVARLYDRIAKDVDGPKAEIGTLARFYGAAPDRAK
jgi:3-hydroxyisobutyrate dehydrogenase-like beta-hydroxyacid dehydrogenase